MSNIITDSRNAITTNNAEKQLFVSTVGPLCEKWNPEPYVRTWRGKKKKSSSFNKWHGSTKLEKG